MALIKALVKFNHNGLSGSGLYPNPPEPIEVILERKLIRNWLCRKHNPHLNWLPGIDIVLINETMCIILMEKPYDDHQK